MTVQHHLCFFLSQVPFANWKVAEAAVQEHFRPWLVTKFGDFAIQDITANVKLQILNKLQQPHYFQLPRNQLIIALKALLTRSSITLLSLTDFQAQLKSLSFNCGVFAIYDSEDCIIKILRIDRTTSLFKSVAIGGWWSGAIRPKVSETSGYYLPDTSAPSWDVVDPQHLIELAAGTDIASVDECVWPLSSNKGPEVGIISNLKSRFKSNPDSQLLPSMVWCNNSLTVASSMSQNEWSDWLARLFITYRTYTLVVVDVEQQVTIEGSE